MKRYFYIIFILIFSTHYAYGRPVHHSRGHSINHLLLRSFIHSFWNPMFPPSHASLIRQNKEIDRIGLHRIKNDKELTELVNSGALVPLPLNSHLTVDPRLPVNRRYCRPWTAEFLTNLSDDFYAKFGSPIRVNSAVRTVEVQKKLLKYNPNAAPISGDSASSHLAGLTVDLERKNLTIEQVRFIEVKLLPLQNQGLIEIEEEHRELCFHIMVSGRYGDFSESNENFYNLN